ncbi:ChbG/HpnK family deacetylase [Paenibacillus motobuensis]|uniref:ChbG/HpnK family deacetylase n=1 Tax=Paenibacillus TaxID=44249 RepID=UPI00203AF722|nr:MULTISPECIES: ChbG/HpnK family deacetylase [Paenibacillus]MCM3041570.1 ChbG/HpnK family deacetylase [Paenibacillus lutimineralis]MCM3648674.1 ChbG/HpnK family deacetylase [Paenibacillus motobuensis]
MGREICIITRADDCGSNHSANLGIERALEGGVLRNVSIMATCPAVREAAEMFAGRDDICFGLHFVLNAEWNDIKWGPVADPASVPSLIEANGWFSPHPDYFKEHPPLMAEIMLELEAQFAKLIELGFHITYVDTHMVPESVIPGLEDELRVWCAARGLIYWWDYLFHNISISADDDAVIEHFGQIEALGSERYLLVTHPAVDSEEMRALGNAYESGQQIARTRQYDSLFWSNPRLSSEYEHRGIRPIRYDEAVKLNQS